MFKNIFSICLSTLLITACLLSSCAKKDTISPVIVLDEPAVEDSVVVIGDSLHIEGTVTDTKLHNLIIQVSKNSTNAILYSVTPSVYGLKSYIIHQHFHPMMSDTGACTLTVSAYDMEGNSSIKTAAFRVSQ